MPYGMDAAQGAEFMSRGIEMRLYGFGRYFRQNRDIGDGLTSSGPRTPFGLSHSSRMSRAGHITHRLFGE
jgi:hypothetical protein